MGNLDPDSLGLMASRILLVACMVAVLAAVEGTTTMNLSAKTSDSSFIRRLRGELEGVHDLGEEAEPESKKSEELAIPASPKVPKPRQPRRWLKNGRRNLVSPQPTLKNWLPMPPR